MGKDIRQYIDDYIRFNDIKKAFLDVNYKFISSTEDGLIIYENENKDQYYFQPSDNYPSENKPYICSFVVRKTHKDKNDDEEFGWVSTSKKHHTH